MGKKGYIITDETNRYFGNIKGALLGPPVTLLHINKKAEHARGPAHAFSLKISHSPTNNCQLTSLGDIGILLNHYELDMAKDILQEVQGYINTRGSLYDIYERYVPRLREVLAKMGHEIRLETNYTNFTDSKMCMVFAGAPRPEIEDIDDYDEDEEDDEDEPYW